MSPSCIHVFVVVAVVQAEATTEGILSEDESRFFWISWRNGLIQVGRGLYERIVHQQLNQRMPEETLQQNVTSSLADMYSVLANE